MKTEKQIKKAAPFFFGAAQVLGSAIFSLVLAVFFFVCAIVVAFHINSIENRVEKLEAERQEISELARDLKEQKKKINADLENQKDSKKLQEFDNILDGFLDRAIKINEAMNNNK